MRHGTVGPMTEKIEVTCLVCLVQCLIMLLTTEEY